MSARILMLIAALLEPCSALRSVATGNASRATVLSNADFASGTYRIRTPGKYELSEDVTFDPQGNHLSWSKIPEDSETYPQMGGYILGFFAALTVEADDVTVDCKGHTMAMSADFHKRQRFFSIIELGSSPFILGAGPPQFSNLQSTTASLVAANQVEIKNCILGLSAHHSIHGNDNNGVTLRDLTMLDFEVAGVALNGASNVYMEGLDVGPSLQNTFSSRLSQAIFMDHIASTLIPDHPFLRAYTEATTLPLRGSTTSVKAVFASLRADLQTFVDNVGTANHAGPLLPTMGNGQALPDGSAIYGLLLHRRGPAVNNFGFCPDTSANPLDKTVDNITLKDINIHDLSLKVDQNMVTTVDGKDVMGVAGDIFRMEQAWNRSDCYAYLGNSFVDAQLALGALRAEVSKPGTPITSDTVSFYFGSSNIPKNILAWAGGGMSCTEVGDLINGLWKASKGKWSCTGDSMRHHNKGAVGMRLGFQENVTVQEVSISNLANLGVANAAPYCNAGDGYQGLDVRPVTMFHTKAVKSLDVNMGGTFTSTDDTKVFPMSGILTGRAMRGDDPQAVSA